MAKIIIFSFAGRRPYLEIQKHYVLDLLDRYENAEYHLWNFSRNAADNAYLQELAASSPRIRIFNQFYEGENPVTDCVKQVGVLCTCVKCRVGKWSEPYRYYAGRRKHWNDLFVKVDDDILFIENDRFGAFLAAIEQTPDGIVSAKVVNNGLCAFIEPPLRDAVVRAGLLRDAGAAEDWWLLCTSVQFLEMAHGYFLDNRKVLLEQELEVHPLPRSRFSINTIGFNWRVMQEIAGRLRGAGMNDEHVISTSFDIQVLQGFLTCHLHYSDQRASLSDERERELLDAYDRLRADYLGAMVG